MVAAIIVPYCLIASLGPIHLMGFGLDNLSLMVLTWVTVLVVDGRVGDGQYHGVSETERQFASKRGECFSWIGRGDRCGDASAAIGCGSDDTESRSGGRDPYRLCWFRLTGAGTGVLCQPVTGTLYSSGRERPAQMYLSSHIWLIFSLLPTDNKLNFFGHSYQKKEDEYS